MINSNDGETLLVIHIMIFEIFDEVGFQTLPGSAWRDSALLQHLPDLVPRQPPATVPPGIFCLQPAEYGAIFLNLNNKKESSNNSVNILPERCRESGTSPGNIHPS